MNSIIHRIAFKSILTVTSVASAFLILLNRMALPGFLWDYLEPRVLRLGMFLAFSRLKALGDKPYTRAYTIHTLLSHDDVSRFVICIQSYLRFETQYPRIRIYDDGSLTARDTALLRHIPRCEVVPEFWATRQFYREYGNDVILAEYRDKMKTTRKITDLPFMKDTAGKTLLMDSDVGFFSKPESLLTYLHSAHTATKIVFISDVQNSYICSLKQLHTLFSRAATERVNTGLLCFDSSLVTKRVVSGFFHTIGKYLNNPEYAYVWTEQTPWALLTAQYKSERLPVTYVVGLSRTPDASICRHYIHTARRYFLDDIMRFF